VTFLFCQKIDRNNVLFDKRFDCEKMNIAIYTFFIVTYILITSRKLSILPIGRPAGALFGATLMVGVGAISPEESYMAIDHDTILLLFSMMVVSAYLQKAGFFDFIARRIVAVCNTAWRMLITIVFISGGLSAFLMNDTVCIFFTPLVLILCKNYRLPYGPFLIALATSANIGSAATLVGNPQNMIIGSFSGLGFGYFLKWAVPAAFAGLLINILLLWLFYRKKIPSGHLRRVKIKSGLKLELRQMALPVTVVLGIMIGFFSGFNLAYTALSGVMVLIVFEHREPKEVFSKVDWTLLVFFSCLFIVVQALSKTGIVESTWRTWQHLLTFKEPSGIALFSLLMVLGSNIVSNVPMVMLAGPFIGNIGNESMGWILLSFTTTIAGNLTLIGSVANIIVAESAKKYYDLGFLEYLKFGFISTVAVLVVGVSTIYLIMN
jgi:Na+/H+ antiporter NhaD/arsenite permease-like protein